MVLLQQQQSPALSGSQLHKWTLVFLYVLEQPMLLPQAKLNARSFCTSIT